MAVWSPGETFDFFRAVSLKQKCAVEGKLTHQVLEDIHVSLFGDVLHFPSGQLSQQLLLLLSCGINGGSTRGSELKLKSRKGSQL